MSAAPAPAGPPPPSRCWNCDEPLSAGSVRCLFCGVVQQSAPAAAPAAPAAAPAAAAVAAPSTAAPATVRPAVVPAPAIYTQSLGAAFAGEPAPAALRVVAFTVDVIVVIAVSIGVALLTRQAAYGAIALAEMVVGLWVLEARTGLTFGNALLRMRTSREDAPYSPGIGRSFVRSLITAIGFLVLAIGAWVVVASSAFDSTRRGRSWADKAARTVVVSVPKRQRVLAASPLPTGPLPAGVTPVGGVALPAAVQPAPGVQIIPAQEQPVALAAPQVVSTARASTLNENSMSMSGTGVAPSALAASPVPVVEIPDPVSRTVIRPSAPEAADSAPAAESILIIFDTGQREQLASPVSVNLGRNPAPTEPTDKLIKIADPESSVSKTHLRLEHSRGTTWVTDGGSTNGTDLISDEGTVTRLTAGTRVQLEDGMRVRAGNRTFTISILLGENS
jgi:hypothetical protein